MKFWDNMDSNDQGALLCLGVCAFLIVLMLFAVQFLEEDTTKEVCCVSMECECRACKCIDKEQ